MRRVLVLGSSGVGKSTFASQLAAIVELPLIHLDAHFWQAGWREPPRDDWSRRLELLLRGDAWIMDGNYRRTIPQRVEAADTVILLTLPRIQCLSRVITRGVRDRGKTRTDLPAECVEQLPDWSFLQRIWLYPRAELGPLLDLLSTYEGRKTIVVLRSSAACRKYLASLLDG